MVVGAGGREGGGGGECDSHLTKCDSLHVGGMRLATGAVAIEPVLAKCKVTSNSQPFTVKLCF